MAGRDISRRQLLQVGSVFGLTLPHLLWARSLPASQAAGRRSEKSCIFIVLSGGLSHIDTLDPKPSAPAEIRGAYSSISGLVQKQRFLGNSTDPERGCLGG